MTNCLVVFSLCCIYLSDVRGLKLAHSGMEITQNQDSHCTPNGNQNLSEVEEVHKRTKRYLLFEKGAAVSVTTAAVKTIVSGVPRGLNIICEESLYYDLPASLALPQKDLAKPVKMMKLASHHQESIKRKYDIQKYRFRNHYVNKINNVEKYEFPKYGPYLTRRKYRSVDGTNDSTAFFDIEGIFFRQIQIFAKRLKFNERHCIMRTICESQHFLFARGHFLFHDVIRIILKFLFPAIRQNRNYLNALRTMNPMDCANLYGPHCKISFLNFFTNKINEDF